MAVPIWKDRYVDLGAPSVSGAGIPYYIYCVAKSETIFTGKAYPKPGETNAMVRINDVCADYLHSYFLHQTTPTMPAKVTFNVYSTDTGGDVQKASVEFYNDWSYDPRYDPETDGMNFPVIRTFAPMEMIPLTLWSGSPSPATIYMENGQTHSYTPIKAQGSDFNDDYSYDYLRTMQYLADSYVLPMRDFLGAAKVVMNGITYYASRYCPRYVLYYLNAYGGWDALPIEGRTKESDSVTHYTNEKVYDNALADARGKENYINELRHTYEFGTRWMDNEQSALMHHLLNSPNVYVHDMESNTIRPIVLTNTATEYKEGRPAWHSYTIEAELAQYRIRR